MLGQETYKQWTKPFDPASRYDGDWSVGSKIKFLSESENGMYSEIVENRENEFVSIHHLGIIEDGVIDTESDKVKSWLPAYENYTFTEKDGMTEVGVDMDIAPEYADMFMDSWPKALAALKEICEA
jgi:hypothetical protein